MMSLTFVSIFLVGSCLTKASGRTPATVTPVNGTHLSFEITTERDVCKSTSGEAVLVYSRKSNPYFDFSYDPLIYIEKHITACWEDENLEIYTENALNRCFFKDGIQMFYILDGKEISLKPGSNNMTQENIKVRKNLNLKIRNKYETKEFQINITESCAPESKSETQNTSFVIAIVFGSVGLLVVLVVVVICFFVIRRWRMKRSEETAKRKKDEYYANEDYSYYDSINPASVHHHN